MGLYSAVPDRCSSCFQEERLVESLSDPDTRAVLAVLDEHGGSLEMDELAAAVASNATGVDPEAVPAAQRRRRRVTLHHDTIPRLASLGLVEYRPDTETVELGDTSLLDSLGVELAAPGDDRWAALATIFGGRRRRTILAVLADGPEPAVPALAEAIVAREADVPRPKLAAAQVRETEIGLHHVDLPKLAAVGLVEDGWRDGPIELDEDRLADLDDLVAIDLLAIGSNA